MREDRSHPLSLGDPSLSTTISELFYSSFLLQNLLHCFDSRTNHDFPKNEQNPLTGCFWVCSQLSRLSRMATKVKSTRSRSEYVPDFSIKFSSVQSHFWFGFSLLEAIQEEPKLKSTKKVLYILRGMYSLSIYLMILNEKKGIQQQSFSFFGINH